MENDVLVRTATSIISSVYDLDINKDDFMNAIELGLCV